MSHSPFNRRSFLKAGVIGAAGTMMSRISLAGDSVIPLAKAENSIITRALGKTGLVLPVVSMGVMRADNPNLVKAALAKGIVHLDTAHGYQEGRNETMLGKLLKEYPRESFVISTKIHAGGMNDKGEFTKDASPAEIYKKFDISMERLGLEYVDILYLHAIETRQAVMYKPILKAFEKIRKSGRVKFLGVSTHTNMPQVLDAAVDAGIYDVVLTSYNFQMKDWQEMNDAIAGAAGAGLGIIGMKTMAGGFRDKERTQRINTRSALKWALQNENIHTTIPGFTSFDQLDESFSVMEDLKMDETELNELFAYNPASSLFCTGCNSCAGTCKKSLPVPDLMRAYMYTYGYRDPGKAQEVLLANSRNASEICRDCGNCTVNCVRGFQVASRIADVGRLRDVPAEFLA